MARLKFAGNGKRDIHGVEEEFDRAFQKLENKEDWTFRENQDTVVAYVHACLLGRAKSGGRHRKVSKAWLYRIIGILRKLSEEWLQKEFDQATAKDWSGFYERLETNQIRKENGKIYSPGTKSKIYKAIRKFLKWRFGGNRYFPSFCQDWVTSEPLVTTGYLTRHEVEQLINGAGTLRVRCMVQMLFDGGFRIEELGNLRWCDIRKWEGKDYHQAHVRAETSKTRKERYVSLYLSTDGLEAYRASEEQRLGPQFDERAYLFARNYQQFYMTIRRLGERILKKHVTPHMMRHSSATYYANIIKTYQQFSVRYGWDLNSKTAQRYFHKVIDDEIAEQAKEHELARFKTDFESVKAQNRALHEELSEMKKEFETFKQSFYQYFIETGAADRILENYDKLKRQA
jgi:integrase